MNVVHIDKHTRILYLEIDEWQIDQTFHNKKRVASLEYSPLSATVSPPST